MSYPPAKASPYFYEEKEVSVYYREVGDERVILTTKARYGKDFPRERETG